MQVVELNAAFQAASIVAKLDTSIYFWLISKLIMTKLSYRIEIAYNDISIESTPIRPR